MDSGVARRASDISGQQKNVVIVEPLARLESDSNVRAVVLQAAGAADARLDLRLIALCMLDHIMEETAFRPGAMAEDVVAVGRDAVMRMDPALGETVATAVSRRVFDHLRNAAGRFREFQTRYHDPADGQWRTHSFRYVESLPDPEDSSLSWMCLAEGGKKLLLGMLDVADDLLEHAERAIMAKAMERERYRDALAAANRARARSAGFRQRIDATVTRAKRSWSTVDLAGDVLPTLDAALTHLRERMADDERLIARLDDKVAELTDQAQRATAATLRSALQDCAAIDSELFRRLASAHVDLEASMLRGLRSAVIADCCDPEADILMPLLAAPIGRVAGCSGLLLAAFSSVAVPGMLDLAGLFGDAIAAHALRDDESGKGGDGDFVPLVEPEPLFTPERIGAALSWITAATAGRGSYSLSGIIGEAADAGFGEASLRLLVLLTLRPLAASPGAGGGMDADHASFNVGGGWARGGLGGDDIIFSRAA
jgi:hypothetical protein